MHTENFNNVYDLFPWIVYDDDPISVLIVEDDAMMQAQFMSLVRTLDYDVTIDRVTTAEDAKRLLQGENFERYDLIIADNFLEGAETGLDLWRFCREHHPQIRFILTSGEQLKSYIDRLSPKLEKPDFLAKPFSPKQAIKKIQNSIREMEEGKLVADVKKRDSVKVSVPEETLLPMGRQRTWQTNALLVLLFSIYLGAVVTQFSGVSREELRPFMKWLPETEDEVYQDEKYFDYYGDSLWNPRPIEPVEIPKIYRPTGKD